VQNLFFLCIVCVLFRPSFNSTRYAYSELEGARAAPAPRRLALQPAQAGHEPRC